MVMLTRICRKGLVDGRSVRLVIKRQPKFDNYPGICVVVKLTCLYALLVPSCLLLQVKYQLNFLDPNCGMFIS